MDFFGLIPAAALGGGFGALLHCVTDYFDTRNKIKLMEATVNAADKTEAWNAFVGSQNSSNTVINLPPTIAPWVANFYICIDGIKQLTRPLLTWAGVAIIVAVYYTSDTSTRTSLANEVVFGSFTSWFWWFGIRYSKTK